MQVYIVIMSIVRVGEDKPECEFMPVVFDSEERAKNYISSLVEVDFRKDGVSEGESYYIGDLKEDIQFELWVGYTSLTLNEPLEVVTNDILERFSRG